MEKFSLYDLLSLIFPGAIWLFLLDFSRRQFDIAPDFQLNQSWEIILLGSLILGGLGYVLCFELMRKKWFCRCSGVYKSVVDLYLGLKFLHSLMNSTLNQRACEYYGTDIYFSQKEWKQLPRAAKDEAEERQDMFYDRMYYELEYEDKFSHAKAFQGFYFFFRQLFVVGSITFLLLAIVFALSFFTHITTPALYPFTAFSIGLFLFILLSNYLARWYRRRMVAKMYWAFFTHLTLTNKKQ